MRKPVFIIIAAALVAPSARAEGPADRIRSLYEAVPFERVRASPGADILAHIEEMGRRNAAAPEALAVPDLDLSLILRDGGGADVLMDPRVLEAIARMPPDRAAETLRIIEAHRNGQNPVEDVPPLSLSGDEPAESLSLRGWTLGRDPNGAPYIQNGADAASRLLIVPSMILGDLGRILSIQDDPSGFRVTLESGEVLEGEVRATTPEEVAVVTDQSLLESVPATAPTTSLRPLPRPEGLVPAPAEAGAGPDDP